MENMNEVLDEVNDSLDYLIKEYPEQTKGFGGFMAATEKEGVLSHKTKELISIALSVATHCRWCIAHHVKVALHNGATEEEIMEACWVATFMGGAPSLMYTQLVVKALEDFKQGTERCRATL